LCFLKARKKLRRIKKTVFLRFVCAVVVLLALVRCFKPSVTGFSKAEAVPEDSVPALTVDTSAAVAPPAVAGSVDKRRAVVHAPYVMPQFKEADGRPRKNRIYSVSGFRECFPDVQDVQIEAARKWGVTPVANREEAERRKDELVFVGSSPYYVIDKQMHRSIPYLVPRAGQLLQRISRNFLDSLAIKGIPLHTVIVTSVLRTEEDVKRLRRHNVNASEQSCHRFGTTFDICYNRYHTVSRPGEPERRAVRNDSLKWVLSEVLHDLRQAGHCYVKYEVKQGCYHITVR